VTDSFDQGLVSPSDIADIAGVSRGAVSNWRKRNESFPQPVAGAPNKPLFSLKEISEWLEQHAAQTNNQALLVKDSDSASMDVWAALNSFRGLRSPDQRANMMLSLALDRKKRLSKRHDTTSDSTGALGRLVSALERTQTDDLASVVDFTLERLSRSQGKMGADSGFVGSRTTTLLANLAAARPGGVLYDPACGIAAALLESERLGAKATRSVGHDIDERALRIAAQRAELHDVHLELTQTDVLAEDVDPSLLADTIILEPPFGLRLDASRRLTDARFDFGPPPRSSADTAWLQHAIAHLAGNGRAYVLSPTGTLVRRGEEGRIRAELVKHACVEAIVGLPGKLLPHTSIPLALWVLRRPIREPAAERVLFIDASESRTPELHVARWLNDERARQDVPRADVAIADVLAADSVLTPNRWVDRTEREPGDVADAYRHGWAAISDTMTKLQSVLMSFQHFASFSKSRVMTVGELIDQGVLEMRIGRPKDRYEDAPEQLRLRLATAADVRDGTLRELGIDEEYDDYPELTWEGDVLVTTMDAIRARVDEAGGHLPSTGVYRLRVRDRDVLSPGYLAIALGGSWNERFQGGTTIQRASIKDLEVPLVPVTEQRDIQLAVLSTQLLHEQSARLAEEAGIVGSALLDAVRYNARLENPEISVGPADEDGPVDTEEAK